MHRKTALLTLLLLPAILFPQEKAIEALLSDSTMRWASVSLLISDISDGSQVASVNPSRSLSQASVLKLVTTAAALEKLGPQYSFKTVLGYSGEIKNGTLYGDIIIKGGGDPTLCSENFRTWYGNLFSRWADEVKRAGIKKVTGRVIADDSRYDFQAVPPDWNWADLGNYYGAGAYGLSAWDNTLKLHFNTGAEGSKPVLRYVEPSEGFAELKNNLVSDGKTDNGYVYLAPYSNKGWIEGTIPPGEEDFVLKASIPDPPLAVAGTLRDTLEYYGIRIKGRATTARLSGINSQENFKAIYETVSPPLSDIIEVLNHESVNLYAEHLVKELGYIFRGKGSTEDGTAVISEFLDSLGTGDGMFILDGSGLSPQNAINAAGLTGLLIRMRSSGNFSSFYNSLPEGGVDGTLRNFFKDEKFGGRLRAKSGSMSRVRSYAGYLKTMGGKEMAFAVIINNYTGPSRPLISHIEKILLECIENR